MLLFETAFLAAPWEPALLPSPDTGWAHPHTQSDFPGELGEVSVMKSWESLFLLFPVGTILGR